MEEGRDGPRAGRVPLAAPPGELRGSDGQGTEGLG